MKRKITKVQMVEYMTDLDTRCKKWDDAHFDRAINNGFAELATVANPFTNELNESLQTYYEHGELVFTLNLPEDVTNVYDLYVMKTANTFNVWKHDEEKCRDEDVIWRSNSSNQIINVDLTKDVQRRVFETAVVKYFYIPTADFDEIYIANDVYLALESAIAAATYDMLHDIEKASQQRAAFTRKGQSLLEPYPEDYTDPGKPSMFPPGT